MANYASSSKHHMVISVCASRTRYQPSAGAISSERASSTSRSWYGGMFVRRCTNITVTEVKCYLCGHGTFRQFFHKILLAEKVTVYNEIHDSTLWENCQTLGWILIDAHLHELGTNFVLYYRRLIAISRAYWTSSQPRPTSGLPETSYLTS